MSQRHFELFRSSTFIVCNLQSIKSRHIPFRCIWDPRSPRPSRLRCRDMLQSSKFEPGRKCDSIHIQNKPALRKFNRDMSKPVDTQLCRIYNFDSFRSSNLNFCKCQSINSRNIPAQRIQVPKFLDFFLRNPDMSQSEISRYVAIQQLRILILIGRDLQFSTLEIAEHHLSTNLFSTTVESRTDSLFFLFCSLCQSVCPIFPHLFLIFFELWHRKLIILKWAKLTVHYQWTWAMVSPVFVKDRHTPNYVSFQSLVESQRRNSRFIPVVTIPRLPREIEVNSLPLARAMHSY